MNSNEFLKIIVNDIHTVVMATVDSEGRPVTCVIDMMLEEDGKLYFLTAKGKNFYKRLKGNDNISFSSIKGEDTMSSISVSYVGKAREIGIDKLNQLLNNNNYMYDIYPTEASRASLTVFEIYEGSGEFFDLTVKPVYRKSFSFNLTEERKSGYNISSKCIECGKCLDVCPTNCIAEGTPYKIESENCLRCGNCFDVCPACAVERL